jgi:hypothetical protein
MITLRRYYMGDDCTLGLLYMPDEKPLYTLELPWRDNMANISCIPEGLYTVKYHISPSLGEVYWIKEVEGRNYIYLHAANQTSEIKGCIAPGYGVSHYTRDRVTHSRDAMAAIFRKFEKRPFSLLIKN